MGSRRLVCFASTAPSLPTTDLDLLLRAWIHGLPAWRKAARVYVARSEVAHPDAQGDDIDLPNFVLAERHGLEVQEEILGRVGKKADQQADSRYGQLGY